MVQKNSRAGNAVSKTGTDDIGWPNEGAQAPAPKRDQPKEPVSRGQEEPPASKGAENTPPEAEAQPGNERVVGTLPSLYAPFERLNLAAQAIFKSLHEVHRAIVAAGIDKDRTNKQQGFKFRGIDDVYAALSPLLVQHNIVTVPRMMERSHTQYSSKQGGNMFNVVVKAEYDFLSTIDGSKITVATFGEGMDSADKATAKAMAVAHKYAHFQLFNIPLEANPELRDPDFESPEIAPEGEPAKKSSRPQAAASRRPAEKSDTAQVHPVEAKIQELLNTEEARDKLRNKVLDAYGVMLLKDIPEDLVDEAVGKVTDCVNAAKKRSAKG